LRKEIIWNLKVVGNIGIVRKKKETSALPSQQIPEKIVLI
jgi:hypothetical protein